jgi:GT2 family glycosyltransferase
LKHPPVHSSSAAIFREVTTVGESPSIALVVLNWNGATDTLDCLASLRKSVVPIHTIVVDNGSTGSDLEEIRQSGLADTVIETGANLGYAGGNNVGLRYALDRSLEFEVVGVLNNDTIVDPHCFGDLVKHLEAPGGTPRAIAPTVLYFDKPDETWFAGGIVERGWPRHLQPGELGPTREPLRASEWLSGCCIVGRATTWRHVGLFDPRYFLIFEDCEWSLRARKMGVDLQVTTESTILHRVSRSFASGPSSSLGSFYFVRNGLYFEYAFAGRHLPRFIGQHLIRPTLSDVVRLKLRPGLGFRWLGALAFLIRQAGPAPTSISRIAEHPNRSPTKRG